MPSWARTEFLLVFSEKNSYNNCNKIKYITGTGPVIESRLRRDFPHPSRLALGLTQPLAQQVPCLLPWGKAAGAWCNHPPRYSAEVKERVQLYLYFAFGKSWSVVGRTSPFTLPWVHTLQEAWGSVLDGRSRDRSPVLSLGIFSEVTDGTMCPEVDSASKNEYQDTPRGKDGRCVRVTTLPPS